MAGNKSRIGFSMSDLIAGTNSSQSTLREAIARQREALMGMLRLPLLHISEMCGQAWPDRDSLNQALSAGLHEIPYCQFLYALDTDAIQISDNASHDGLLHEHYARDRSTRPYLNQVVPSEDFLLSEAYMSLRAHRPSVTAIHVVRKEDKVVGFIGADFDLRDLPLTRQLYEEPNHWRQIKGDPSIRRNVFSQTRTESQMDRRLDDVLPIVEELMTDHGIFHGKIHLSSSRATIWLVDDPYRYRILDIDALTDPGICLAYPRMDYPKDAVIPANKIGPILEAFRQLRFADESLYLRAGGLNIFNGLVSLNFSCDGSHYVPYVEFLDKDMSFWGIGLNPAKAG